MEFITYPEAYTEVLDILAHTRKEDVDKIPEKFMQFLRDNCSKTHKPNFDHTKTIKELNLNTKTQAVLGIIYMNYWADEQGKKEFKERMRQNEIKFQEEARKKYSTDDLFKNRKKKQ